MQTARLHPATSKPNDRRHSNAHFGIVQKAKYFGDLEIDCQLEFGRLLHGDRNYDQQSNGIVVMVTDATRTEAFLFVGSK